MVAGAFEKNLTFYSVYKTNCFICVKLKQLNISSYFKNQNQKLKAKFHCGIGVSDGS